VGLIARSEMELRRTHELIEKAGGTAAAATADVTDPAGLQEAIDRLRRHLGRFDLLVNNAGILGPVGPLWEVDADAWWTTMDVNVRGLVLCTRLVMPDMIAAGRGRVINVTSQAGVHRWPLVSGYSVSKAAVVKLTENLALGRVATASASSASTRGCFPSGCRRLLPATSRRRHMSGACVIGPWGKSRQGAERTRPKPSSC
jgi:NAD(P)-dependent dehydrogenase (short-subunit alcohol dehydrogenase family)